MANNNLTSAKNAKNDEFYTQWADIQKEVNAYLEFNPDVFRGKVVLCPCDDPEWSNFTKFFALHFHDFGLKKLISTSFAADSNKCNTSYQPTLFETESPKYDAKKTSKFGKIFVLERTADNKHKPNINIDDLQWDYLPNDGDFRSSEVTKLREEVDIIITNPPFSLFREFLAWIMDAEKQFLIIGNMNAITYKEVFPLIKENKVWLGPSISSGDREFGVPEEYPLYAAGSRIDNDGKKYIRIKGVRWFTNLDHGRRHQPMTLLPAKENLRFSRHKDFRSKAAYDTYDNYAAIDVPYTDVIPSDYEGVMGVPISFLDKYCPEQFEILGTDFEVKDGLLEFIRNKLWNGKFDRGYVNGERLYSRILIKHREGEAQ
ncbi:adenine-specific methyltransferase EcoRI family protein [Breznakiellaceae bacterium SP9]